MAIVGFTDRNINSTMALELMQNHIGAISKNEAELNFIACESRHTSSRLITVGVGLIGLG